MLDTSVNGCLYSRVFDMFGNVRHDIRDILFALGFSYLDLVRKIVINFGFKIFERQIVKFDLHLRNT